MATGNSLILLNATDGTPPATIYATLDTITGTSTPAEAIPVLDFDDTTQEYMDFYCVMPQHYAGGGLTVIVGYSTADTTDVVDWEIALRRVADDAEDLDTTAHTYDFNDSAEIQPPSVLGETTVDNITFTSGADMDSTAAGDQFVMRVRRNPAATDDTLGEDTYLHSVLIYET